MTPEKRPAEETDEVTAASKKLKEVDCSETSTAKSKDILNASTTKADSENDKQLCLPKESGTLLICGSMAWDAIGKPRSAVPPDNHYSPSLWKPMLDVKVSYIASHSSAAHAVVITQDGQAMTFGRNDKSQLGTGDTEVRNEPTVVEALKDQYIVAAAVGRHHSLFLTDEGTVFACGDNKSGQCGLGNTTPMIQTPSQIKFDKKVMKIACGAEFSMIVDDRGHLYSFGLPEYGQLGHNTDGKYFVSCNKLAFQSENAPKRVPVFIEKSKDGHPTPINDVQIVDVACGNNHTVAIDSKKRAYSWGFGGYGRLGHADPKDELVPRFIKFFDGPKRGVHQVFCGSSFAIAKTEIGLYLWGQTKRTGEANMYPKPLQDLCGWDVRDVGCSGTSVVVAAENTVISWGPSPTYGELGLGEHVKSSTKPKEVKALENSFVYRVTCSLGFTLMIIKDDEDEDKAILDKLETIGS